MEQTVESKDINIGILKEKLRYCNITLTFSVHSAYKFLHTYVHAHTPMHRHTHVYTRIKIFVFILLLDNSLMRILKKRRV